MDIQTILETLRQNIIQTSYIEIIAVFFGLISVWFAKKENVWVYPTGILNVLIYVYLFFKAHFYANMGINFFYFIMNGYGWYNWTRKSDDGSKITISYCNTKEYIINGIAILGSFALMYFVLIRYTNSPIPFWDSFTTAIYLVAMWLMTQKKIENWILWIIGDLALVPITFTQGMPFTSLQYLVFLFIATFGLLEWNKKYKESLQHA